jgi:SP family general alpha glucoside:H+ symporter-like MFS transporter
VIESVTKNWWTWLIAKLFAGIGVGSLQATLPVYISEHSPTQLRGFLINAYTLWVIGWLSYRQGVCRNVGWPDFSWFVVGQLMAPVALNELNATHPYDFKTAIYTQWAMIGITIIIYVFLPESPCEWSASLEQYGRRESLPASGWLVSKSKLEQAEKVLVKYNGHVADYDVHEEIVRRLQALFRASHW